MSKKTIDQIRDEVEAKRARFDAGSELIQQLEYVKRWYELEDGADLTTDSAKRSLAATEFLNNIASYILANI